MRSTKKNGRLLKNAIAVILGITMAFSALMMPANVVTNELTTANAYEYQSDDYTFTYSITDRTGEETINIIDVKFTGDTVRIPSTINHEGVDLPVTDINENFLKNNGTVKTVIFPDSVTYFGSSVLSGSSVERIVLSNNIEHLGGLFASNCFSLSSVECDHINATIDNVGGAIMQNCWNMKNENGAVCIGDLLIEYSPPSDMTELRVTDLGTKGKKIRSIANYAIHSGDSLTTLDLEGIVNIGSSNFSKLHELKHIVNTDSIKDIGEYSFTNTPWYEDSVKNDIVKLGSTLIYYKTDSNVIDTTSGELEGIKRITKYALKDCVNADTLMCTSDCMLSSECFYVAHDPKEDNGSTADPLPPVPTYKIKNIYLDGKKLAYSDSHPELPYWVAKNFYALKGSEWLMDNAEAKARALFKQLDIPYYGVYNDKMGTLSKEEEFYTVLKIHDYISTYDYDLLHEYHSAIGGFLCGGKMICGTYAELNSYLLECAGVRSLVQSCGLTHGWNELRIGDEWFVCDDGWDEQYSHTYGWFGLSTPIMQRMDRTFHVADKTAETWHYYSVTEPYEANRLMGDTDANEYRNALDSKLLWDYIKGETDTIDETAADINFDGKIDVNDAVLLENLVSGNAIDIENRTYDGLAPGFKVAFVNGKDYDNIQYRFTERDGYFTLPDDVFEAPEGKKLKGYNIGRVGEKVKISKPYTIITPIWADKDAVDDSSKPDSSKPDSSSKKENDPANSETDTSKPDKNAGKLGDVNNDRSIDIEDAVAIIQHINGVTALTADEESRADVSKDKNIDIDDAVTLISYINGNSTF